MTARPILTMKKFITLLTLAAGLAAVQADDFTAVHSSMTWTPVHSITNQVGEIAQGRTAPASKQFWQAWRTNKPAMRQAGYSARPTTNGWEAIQYIKTDKKGAKQ